VVSQIEELIAGEGLLADGVGAKALFDFIGLTSGLKP